MRASCENCKRIRELMNVRVCNGFIFANCSVCGFDLKIKLKKKNKEQDD